MLAHLQTGIAFCVFTISAQLDAPFIKEKNMKQEISTGNTLTYCAENVRPLVDKEIQ
jgi:hypothetical protein